MTDPEFLVKVWGARGSLPAPAARNVVFGSETCSIEMRCGGHVLIFDVGSAAEALSGYLTASKVKDLDIFFSHCHLDHIMGLPFLKPLYDHEVAARIHAGHFEDATTCKQMVENFMAPPYFPVTPKYFDAHIRYVDFRPPDTLTPQKEIVIETMRLKHPNGCVGYRVSHAQHAVCYLTDTEHVAGRIDEKLVGFIRGADAIVYDCMYTDAEFSHFRGYGHSTWEEGVRLCEAAGVKRLLIFHHRPGRNDDDLSKIESDAQARFPGAIVARSGLELVLG
jgi:phosphoribosyl 1,2-cyclic phosphodiesterase